MQRQTVRFHRQINTTYQEYQTFQQTATPESGAEAWLLSQALRLSVPVATLAQPFLVPSKFPPLEKGVLILASIRPDNKKETA